MIFSVNTVADALAYLYKYSTYIGSNSFVNITNGNICK